MVLLIQWSFAITVIITVFIYSFLEIKKYKKQKRIITEFINMLK
jgi:hypothetical protein